MVVGLIAGKADFWQVTGIKIVDENNKREHPPYVTKYIGRAIFPFLYNSWLQPKGLKQLSWLFRVLGL